MYSGAEAEGMDFIALGLDGGYPVFALNLGSGAELIVSDKEVPLNEFSTVRLIRNKKDGM